MLQDVLNRYPSAENPEHTVQVSKHIFPRQYGLHNGFMSHTAPNQTTRTPRDYTLQGQEIAAAVRDPKIRAVNGSEPLNLHIPKRLRGRPWSLIQKIQSRHLSCSYTQLLRHYCPSATASSSNCLLGVTTPSASVSAFCRAVIGELVPLNFLGYGVDGRHNRAVLMRIVDLFVRMRRFESLSLHTACQNMKVNSIGSSAEICP